jgi:hypothetical protein
MMHVSMHYSLSWPLVEEVGFSNLHVRRRSAALSAVLLELLPSPQPASPEIFFIPAAFAFLAVLGLGLWRDQER